MPSIIDGLPNIYADEDKLNKYTVSGKKLYSFGDSSLSKIRTAFGIALHMHQPTIPASHPNLSRAELIGNLEYMLKHQDIGDNHNAPIFLRCYERISDFIIELVTEGKHPRIMLDYSGNLLWGLEQMGEKKVLDKLALVTTDKKYFPYVEWLGTMWSHAVVPSTPIPDIKLHIRAWQSHFAAIFGYPALARVKGFSAPEMQLPIHPDVCYEYIKALKECGYQWLMVQEHTIENLAGSGIKNPYFPHKLVAKNSLGQKQEITVLIKTQGSDTKLVGQMQPYYEAQSKNRQPYLSKILAPYVLQISDGENGGVMMNEFPPKYKAVMREVNSKEVVAMNGSEYLEWIESFGLSPEDFLPVAPLNQHKLWEFVDEYSSGSADKAIAQAKKKYPGFNLDKASWTNDREWVKGYEDVLNPINSLSVEFHRCFDQRDFDRTNPLYRQALLYLLLSQTSCFRYWGQGLWTDYAREICRRGSVALKKV